MAAVQQLAVSKRKSSALKLNTVKLNLVLDIALALAFVVELEMRFTGLRNHELIGVGMGIALVVHLVLHWKWIWNVTRTFFRKLFHTSRFNYVLNVALLVDLGVIIVTGILISETLGLNLGVAQDARHTYESLHKLASNFSLMLVGLHVAIHWKWILSNSKKYLFRLPFLHTKPTVSQTQPTSLKPFSEE